MKVLRRTVCLFLAVCVFSLSICTSAHYVPDYLANSLFYQNNTKYFDKANNQIELVDYIPSDWFNYYFKDQYQWRWIRDPHEAACKLDVMRFVYDLEMSQNNYELYPKSVIRFQDLESHVSLRTFREMAQILNYAGILTGVSDNNIWFAEWDKKLTRAEFAKILFSANESWWHLSEEREKVIFEDAKGHWAEDYIMKVYSLGIMNGLSGTLFDPDQIITNEQVVKTLSDIANKVYSYENFIDSVNVSDIVKITESYINYYDFSPRFTDKTIYYRGRMPDEVIGFAPYRYPNNNCVMYKDKTIYVLVDGNGLNYTTSIVGLFSNNITQSEITSDHPGFLINYGSIDTLINGEATYTVSNKYGSDTVKVVSLKNVSDFPQRPQQ